MSGLPHMFGGSGEGARGRDFWRRFLRRNQSCCAACGYALSGLEAPTCPECGRHNSLGELALQANFESAAWYLASGWGLFFCAMVGVPVGVVLVALGAAGVLQPAGEAGLAQIVGGAVALVLPVWAGAWLRACGARIHVNWGAARWSVAAVCWLPVLPLLGVGMMLATRLVGSLITAI